MRHCGGRSLRSIWAAVARFARFERRSLASLDLSGRHWQPAPQTLRLALPMPPLKQAVSARFARSLIIYRSSAPLPTRDRFALLSVHQEGIARLCLTWCTLSNASLIGSATAACAANIAACHAYAAPKTSGVRSLRSLVTHRHVASPWLILQHWAGRSLRSIWAAVARYARFERRSLATLDLSGN